LLARLQLAHRLSLNLFIDTMSAPWWTPNCAALCRVSCAATQLAPCHDSPRRARFVVLRTLCRTESHCANRGHVASSCAASRVTPCRAQVKPRRSSDAASCVSCSASRAAPRVVSHQVAPCHASRVASRRTGSGWGKSCGGTCATPGRVVLYKLCVAPDREDESRHQLCRVSATMRGLTFSDEMLRSTLSPRCWGRGR
jgi:hypothetical protein